MNASHIFTAALTLVLTGCGGGDGTSSSSAAQISVAASFHGAYVNSGDACGFTSFIDREFVPVEVRMPSVPDSLAVDAGNTAYRVCGSQLWVGPIAGTLVKTNSPVAAPLSGTGSVSFAVYASGAGTTAAVSGAGTLLAIADAGAVTSIQFANKNPSGAALNFSAASASGRVTASYATLAATFKEENFYPLYTTPTGTLTVGADGSFSGSSASGAFAGRITQFDSRQGVHAVQANVRLASGSTIAMTGIMAPTDIATGGNGNSLPGVLLALTGNGIGFVAAYRP